ncbi:MAG TPA: hypothetical protein VIK26_03305 [Clostridium sp.]
MINVSFLEFIIRGIPEGLIFFMAAHAITKNIIQVKRYLFSSLLCSVMIYLIKLLPINNGAGFILNLIIFMALAVIINKFDIIQSIKAGIIIILIEFISEGVNIFVIQFILKKDWNYILSEPIRKLMYFSPSLLVVGCLVIAYYIILFKRKELK